MPRTPRRDRLPPSYAPGASPTFDAPPDGSVAWEPDPPSPAVSIPPEQPGRYRDTGDGPIGQGGLGVVLAVWDEVLGREVACKVLARGPAGAAAAERMIREARATARLQHPGIVPVYDLGRRPDGAPYYTMKYVRGRTLAAAIAARATLRERLGLLGAFVDACQAVAYAHSQGVLHRDLKPANVMVGEFGETVVLDWGLARVREEPDAPGGEAAPASATLTVAGAVLGTPAYMAPEQAAGAAVDARADVWSLGVVLYEILAGHPPFTGEDAAEVLRAVLETEPPPLPAVCPEAPPELAAIVARALARRPADRYARAADLAEDVEHWRNGGRVGAYTYSPWELARRFVARHRVAFAVGAVGLLALTGLGAVSAARILAERDRAQAAEAVALAREAEAESNLADALAEKAVATPEDDPFTAEVYAAGALAQGERPEARGVIARAERRWAPRPEARIAADAPCRALRWAGEALLCLTTGTVTAWGPDRAARWTLALDGAPSRGEIALSPDARRGAVALDAGVVLVFDVGTGAALARLDHGRSAAVHALAWSADGTRLYTGASEDQHGLGVIAWDPLTGARLAASPEPLYVEALSTAPDGGVWAAVRGVQGLDHTWIVALDPATLRRRASLASPDSAWGLAWSPDGRWLAAAAGEGTSYVWDAHDLAAGPSIFGERGGLGARAWSPDGALLVELREEGRATFWRAGAWRPLFGTSLPPLSWRALAFSADGARFATASEAGVTIWRLGPPPAPDSLFADAVPGNGLEFLADGSAILLDDPEALTTWRDDGAPVHRVATPARHSGASPAPDGTVLVGTSTGAQRLDPATGAVLGTYGTEPTRLADVADAGRRVVTLGEDGTLAGWTADGARAWALPGYTWMFAGDEPRVLAFEKADAVDLVDAADGAVRRVADGAALFWGGLSRNGRWAVLSARDGTVIVVDTRTAEEVARFAPYGGLNTRVAASDDGRLVAAGGADRAIRLWDRELGRVVAVLRGHDQRLQALAFSPDGRLLVSDDWSGEVRSWDLADLRTSGAELLARAERDFGLRLEGARVLPARP